MSLADDIKRVETDHGIFLCRSVIIATGADPRRLGVPGEQEHAGRGVHYCAHCDGRFYKGKRVALVGGGNSAVSDALYLSRMAEHVTLIHRRDSLRADKVYRDQLLSAENIDILWNSRVESIRAEEKIQAVTVSEVNTGEEREIPCEGVFVSIGRVPATQFLSGQVDLDKNGYIIADESTKTGVSGVYAAGDVRTKVLRQVVSAVCDGAVAAHFAGEYTGKR